MQKVNLHFNNIMDDKAFQARSPVEAVRQSIINIIEKSLDSVTTDEEYKKQALDEEKNIREFIAAVFEAGLEDKKGFSRVFRGIKTFAIMGTEFILHGIGECISLLDSQVTTLLLILPALAVDDNKGFTPISIIIALITSILLAAWKISIAPLALAADILDWFTHSLTRLFDNWSRSPKIAFFFSLIPTLLIVFQFIGLVSLGAVSAIFTWPLIVTIVASIGIGLFAGSLAVELVKPFEEEIIKGYRKPVAPQKKNQIINNQVNAPVPQGNNKNTTVPDPVEPPDPLVRARISSATSSLQITTTEQRIDKDHALRIAAAGAVGSTLPTLPTLNDLFKDPDLKNFINKQDSNPEKGYTALHLAVKRYDECKRENVGSRANHFYRIITGLLAHGACHNIVDNKGKTAFEYTDNANYLCERLKNDGITNFPQISNSNYSAEANRSIMGLGNN